MQIGFIGLGKMGSRMAEKLVSDGHEVMVWNRSSAPIEELKLKVKSEKLKVAETIEKLICQLETPKVVWIMVSHQSVEEVLAEVRKFIEKGDIVIDGGNSFYKDTDRRFGEFEKSGINFLGIGVSGGVIAFEKGYPLMVGGSHSGYETIIPILDSLAKPNGGHEYLGTGGAGHFVKMVHNGIEYGIMQSLGEGFEVLEKSKYEFNLLSVAKLWQKGTIISGFLTDRVRDALEKDSALSDSAGPISASGEGEWTVNTAKEENVDVEIIESSLKYRQKSQTDEKIQDSFTARVINALRREFGGHTVRSVHGKEAKKG
ncbi:MAG: hypothetical protein ACD_37C00355G0002 [uncultured bacterium]|nr:MAG: hypothetical protein ACD_37C00355G0002 [uncultured bacterium]